MSTAEQDIATPVEEQPTTGTPPVDKPQFRMNADVDANGVRAFIHLPNQFQFDDIRRKALAAKARRVRQLRDPEADAFIILDEEMDRLRRHGEVETLVEEIARKDWWKDHLEAVADVREEERFAHIEDDEQRHLTLRALPEDERPADEYAELERTVAAYDEAVVTKRNERQEPRKEALGGLHIDDLVERVRDMRVEGESDTVFNLTFTKYQIASCALKVDEDGKPTRERYFANVEAVEGADPVTIDTLTAAFTELEQQFGRGLGGNV